MAHCTMAAPFYTGGHVAAAPAAPPAPPPDRDNEALAKVFEISVADRPDFDHLVRKLGKDKAKQVLGAWLSDSIVGERIWLQLGINPSALDYLRNELATIEGIPFHRGSK